MDLDRRLLSVAPIKALCNERYEDWSHRFAVLGLRCLELTGDSLMYDYSELQDVHIILTTPVSGSSLCYWLITKWPQSIVKRRTLVHVLSRQRWRNFF